MCIYFIAKRVYSREMAIVDIFYMVINFHFICISWLVINAMWSFLIGFIAALGKFCQKRWKGFLAFELVGGKLMLYYCSLASSQQKSSISRFVVQIICQKLILHYQQLVWCPHKEDIFIFTMNTLLSRSVHRDCQN